MSLGLLLNNLWQEDIGHVFANPKAIHAGCHLVFWRKILDPLTSKPLFFPRVLYPASAGVKAVDFTSPTTDDPTKWVFLPGRNMDMLIHPKPVQNSQAEAYIITNGDVSGPYVFYFTGALCMELYADKYLLVLTSSSLLMINIFNREITHTFHDLPRSGTLAVWRDQAVVWSREDNAKVTLMLEKQTPQSPVHFASNMDADETIRKCTIDACVTYAANGEIRLYDASGKRVYSHSVGMPSSYMGSVTSHESRGVAVLFAHPDKSGASVAFFRNGQVTTKYMEGVTSKNLVLYRDVLYGSFSALESMLERLDLSTTDPFNPRVLTIKYTDHLKRCFKLSLTHGWLVEVFNPKDEEITSLRLYRIQGHAIPAFCAQKCSVGLGTMANRPVPAFMYRHKGSVMVWKPGMSKSGKSKCTLNLHRWDTNTETLVPTANKPIKIETPVGNERARWFSAGTWVVLTVGKRAFVMDHDGNAIADRGKARKCISLDDYEETRKVSVSFVSARGYADSLWLIWGKETAAGTTMATGVIFWDGKDTVVNVDWMAEPIILDKSVATGKRSPPPSYGRPYATFELIIKSARANDSKPFWKHMIYNCSTKAVGSDLFAPEYTNKDVLCTNCEPGTGTVAFSAAVDLGSPAVIVYRPGARSDVKFDVYGCSPEALKNGVKTNHNAIRALRYGIKFLWVVTDQNFYKLRQEVMMETKVREYLLPVVAVQGLTPDKRIEQYQTPSAIIIQPGEADPAEDQAIFKSSRYTWRSDLPMSLFSTPPSLAEDACVVVTSRGHMLVLNTHVTPVSRTQGEEDNGIAALQPGHVREVHVTITEVIV